MLKNKPKLLFIISKDFGELHDALLFAEPLIDKNEILFLLPEKLYDLNYADFPFCVKKYQTWLDLKKEIKHFIPDICFLFSGYLLTVNKLLTDKELAIFLKLINAMKIKLVTSDPWLNIWSNSDTTSYPSLNFNDPAQLSVYKMFENLSVKFKDIYHLYFVPLDKKPKKSLHFYNQNIRLSVWQKIRARIEFRREFSLLAAVPFWLFVVSAEEANFLADKIEIIAEKLKETVKAGRRAVFIAPEKLIIEIKQVLFNCPDVLFLTELSLIKFKKILLQAEFVFYWNIFSSTIYDRLINNKPVFSFDVGHMANYFPPFLEEGRKIYYGQNQLLIFNIEEKISLKKINAQKNLHKHIYDYFYQQRSKQPRSRKVLEILL